jgi:hypothetical protein
VSVKKRAIYHQWTEYSCSLCARFVGCSWHQFCDEHYITCYITCSVRVVCTRLKVGFAFFQNGQRPISSEIRSRSKCKRHNLKKKKQHTNVAVHVTVTQRKCVRWPVLRRGRRKSPIIIISNVTLSMRKRPLNGRHG